MAWLTQMSSGWRRLSAWAAMVVLAMTALPAASADTTLLELERRVSTDGVESVNAYLASQGAWSMAALHQATAGCELQAVGLTAELARGSRSEAVDAHRESLRAALGGCMRFVLAVHTLDEVPRLCASSASWTITQTARELRRRIQAIDGDPLLRASLRGKACRAAYHHELHHTRVGLKVGPARPAPAGP